MRILSVDWDYFFPDSLPYDWGAQESPLFIDFLWHSRVRNRNLVTHKPAIEEYHPTVPDDFWNQVLSDKPQEILLAESHCHIFDLFKRHDPAEVVNLDAHHDFAYGDWQEVIKDGKINITAGNWAWAAQKLGLLDSYLLCYPEWRKKVKENGKIRIRKTYRLPKPRRYDAVFVCRSGAWTPPWYDDRFWKLVDGLQADKRTVRPELTKRPLTLATAMKLRNKEEGLVSNSPKGIVTLPAGISGEVKIFKEIHGKSVAKGIMLKQRKEQTCSC